MTNTPNTPKSNHSIFKLSRGLLVMLTVGMLAGVLIWAKLRLVTDIPRSAYADPRETRSIEEQSDEQVIEQANDQPIDQEQTRMDIPDADDLDSGETQTDQFSKP